MECVKLVEQHREGGEVGLGGGNSTYWLRRSLDMIRDYHHHHRGHDPGLWGS